MSKIDPGVILSPPINPPISPELINHCKETIVTVSTNLIDSNLKRHLNANTHRDKIGEEDYLRHVTLSVFHHCKKQHDCAHTATAIIPSDAFGIAHSAPNNLKMTQAND